MTLFTGTFSLSEEITYTDLAGEPTITWIIETSGTITLDLTDLTTSLHGTTSPVQVHFNAVNTWHDLLQFGVPLYGDVIADEQLPISTNIIDIPFDVPTNYFIAQYYNIDTVGPEQADQILLIHPVWTDSTHTGFTADLRMYFIGPNQPQVPVILDPGLSSVGNVVDYIPITFTSEAANHPPS